MNGGLRRARRSARARGRPDERADPDGRVQVADAGLALVEELERGHDEIDLEHPGDERLRREEADEHAQRRVAADRAEPANASETIVAGLDLGRGRSCARAERRMKIVETASIAALTANTVPVEARASMRPASAGPTKTARLSNRARHRVRRGQLGGCLRERRSERGLRGAERRRRDRGRDGSA